MEARVIQGSVLGPILFLLFIADINEYVPTGCNLMKYADDILVYILGRDNCNLAQDIAAGVEKWCQVNKMRLNEGKCKVLYIPDNNIDTALPLVKLSDKPLEIVESYKYLGIDINDKLDWSQHWERIRKRIGPVPYLLKQLKLDGFKEEILVTVYRSHLLSHIGYSAPALLSAPSFAAHEMQGA